MCLVKQSKTGRLGRKEEKRRGGVEQGEDERKKKAMQKHAI